MRLRRTELRRRINADLMIRSSDSNLSSHAGLELLRRFLSKIEFARLLRDKACRHLPRSDFGRVSMILVLLALILSGGRRLRHLHHCQDDPLVSRFCSLSRMPSARSVGRWLSQFDAHSVDALRSVNLALAKRVIDTLGAARVTIDIDGSVVSTGLQAEGARRGYNPHRRKVPSYYPISAYEANSGVMLNVLNRSGNVHDGKASLAFIAQTLSQCQGVAGRRVVREMRLDGAFFRADILGLLSEQGVEYAIKVPFHPWLGLTERILTRHRWSRVDDEVECFAAKVRIKPWKRTERITIYRRLVNHRRSKHFQLDLFDPDDGHYEYSAVASNKRLSGRALWQFMNGRGTHEKVYGELKSGFAFATVPTQSYHANSAWQVINLMAFNLSRAFQMQLNEPKRAKTQKRRTHIRFSQIQTLRHQLINRAGRMVNTAGKAVLEIGSNSATLEIFQQYEQTAKTTT